MTCAPITHFLSRTRGDFTALASLVIPSGISARALAPDGRNGGAHLGDGPLEALGAKYPDAAILGKIRPDLLAIDMDGTADWFDDLEEAAARVGALRVYAAVSGSPGSLHVVYAPPTVQARKALVIAVQALGEAAGGGLDARNSRQWLRLPGSRSLKAGRGCVHPVVVGDGGFVAISPQQALREARAALKARRSDRRALGCRFDLREFDRQSAGQGASRDSRTDVASDGTSFAGLTTRTSRALDEQARAALSVPCPPGQDATVHALRAAWHLWRCGYREWAEVAGIVLRAPALARWCRGGVKHARRRWVMEAAKWEAWRPQLDDDATAVLEGARVSAALLPAGLETVLVAILAWMQRAGRVQGVPIAVRDLIVWGACSSRGSAQRAVEDLETGGVLVRARRWEDGPPEEATLWSLQPPTLWQMGQEISDCAGKWDIPTHPLPYGEGYVYHPVWLELGALSRRAHTALARSSSSTTAVLSEELGIGLSSTRARLQRLEASGLVSRSQQGRSTIWSASTAKWSSLPVVRAAEERHRQRVRQMGAEREVWRDELDRAQTARSAPQEGVFLQTSGQADTPARLAGGT